MPIPRSQLAILLFTGAILGGVVWMSIHRPLAVNDFVQEPITLRIEINYADVDTLCLLPEVASGIAQHIIDYRESVGPITSPDDLEAVPFIGPKKRAAIEPWITLRH